MSVVAGGRAGVVVLVKMVMLAGEAVSHEDMPWFKGGKRIRYLGDILRRAKEEEEYDMNITKDLQPDTFFYVQVYILIRQVGACGR